MTDSENMLGAALKTFVESAPVLCLAADKDFITFYVNPFYETVHNITLEEAKGKHIKDIIGEEGFADNLKHYTKTLEGNVVVYNGSFEKLDGAIHHYQATYAPIYVDDEVVGITGVVIDTTSQVEIDKANERLKRAKDDLEKLATTDPLTGLFNRRHFTEISSNIFALSKRSQRSLSVILLDLDKFKAINDTQGHSVGDQVLVDLSKILQDQTRVSDVVCRFGGEEFLILLPEAGLDGAVGVAEKIRKTIENTSVQLDEGRTLAFTASLGVSVVDPLKDTSIEDVIIRADKNLYAAKDAGRNRVVFL